MTEPILVWNFEDAPDRYKRMSEHGGDEDWVALVPLNYPRFIPWLENGSGQFGVCDISEHTTDLGYRVFIGAHA